MTTQQKIFISTFVILLLLTEKLIWYLFPFTGLGGLICWPSTIIIAGISSFIIYRIIKKKGLNTLAIVLTFFLFIADTFLLIEIHPQDYGGDPKSQIGQCITAYEKYDQIGFDTFATLNKADRVTYIHKFKNQLPLSVSILYIDKEDGNETSSRSYEIFNYSDKIKYDTSKIGLQQNGDFVVLTEKVNPNVQTKHIIRRKFLNDNGTGYIDTTNKFFYNINKDNFELKSGIENEFYRLLNLTKKASR